MPVQPYLFFNGRCEEAIAFYRGALSAELTALMRFGESPQSCPPGRENHVMHAALRVGDSTFMLSDGPMTGPASFAGFALSVSVPTAADADRTFTALAEGGGAVLMPLTETTWSPRFYSPRFGMVADRFGVSWMVIATPPG